MSEPIFHAGDVLRKWRELRGWTGDDLAVKSGVDRDTITRAEKGKSVTGAKLDAIAAAFGRSMADAYRAIGAGTLTEDEGAALTLFRRLTRRDRALMIQVIERLGREARDE